MKKGLRRVGNQIFKERAVGGGALMKKGLRPSTLPLLLVAQRLEVVP